MLRPDGKEQGSRAVKTATEDQVTGTQECPIGKGVRVEGYETGFFDMMTDIAAKGIQIPTYKKTPLPNSQSI